MRLPLAARALTCTAVASVLLVATGCSGSDGVDDPTITQPSASTPATVAPGSTSATSSDATPSGADDWPMYHGRPDHAGISTTMPQVDGTPRVIHSLALDGAVYASPIVVDGITVVATEHDIVYGFDAQYRQLWKEDLGDPSPGSERECGNIDPLGITGTPVYSADSGLVYVAPEYGGPPRHELAALDVHTGEVAWRRSIDLPGVETRAMQERGALAISAGRVWVPFGGLAGDCGGYKGRVVGIALDGTGDPVSYTVPTTREAGIWTPPGPAVDASGDLYVAVGNGESGPGDRYDYSDSVLRIGTDGKLVDSFSPTTWATDNAADLDLGSQGPALVGDRWVFAAGKSGTAYVLRRDDLGGIGGQVSQGEVCASYGGTAVDGDVIYVPCSDGVRAVRIRGDGTMNVLWRVDTPSVTGSPVVGGGHVWTLDPAAGVLHALDPQTGKTLAQVSVGETSRFATPALSGRNVLVGTLTGLAVVATS